MLENFKKYINEDAGLYKEANNLDKVLEQLYSLSDFFGKSRTRKQIVKELGSGYNKDFDSIVKDISNAITTLEEIFKDVKSG